MSNGIDGPASPMSATEAKAEIGRAQMILARVQNATRKASIAALISGAVALLEVTEQLITASERKALAPPPAAPEAKP